MCGLLFSSSGASGWRFWRISSPGAVMIGFISGLGVEVFTSQVGRSWAPRWTTDPMSGVCASDQGRDGQFGGHRGLHGGVVLALMESIPRANVYSVAIGWGVC